MKYNSPLPPPQLDKKRRRQHIVRVMKPREEWALIFYEWAKGLGGELA